MQITPADKVLIVTERLLLRSYIVCLFWSVVFSTFWKKKTKKKQKKKQKKKRFPIKMNGDANPASVLYKSIAGRYWPVSYPDGPITARYRFIKNAYWEDLATKRSTYRIVIRTNLVELASMMITFQYLVSALSWFWRRFICVFTIYGHIGHLCLQKVVMCSKFNTPSIKGST